MGVDDLNFWLVEVRGGLERTTHERDFLGKVIRERSLEKLHQYLMER